MYTPPLNLFSTGHAEHSEPEWKDDEHSSFDYWGSNDEGWEGQEDTDLTPLISVLWFTQWLQSTQNDDWERLDKERSHNQQCVIEGVTLYTGATSSVLLEAARQQCWKAVEYALRPCGQWKDGYPIAQWPQSDRLLYRLLEVALAAKRSDMIRLLLEFEHDKLQRGAAHRNANPADSSVAAMMLDPWPGEKHLIEQAAQLKHCKCMYELVMGTKKADGGQCLGNLRMRFVTAVVGTAATGDSETLDALLTGDPSLVSAIWPDLIRMFVDAALAGHLDYVRKLSVHLTPWSKFSAANLAFLPTQYPPTHKWHKLELFQVLILSVFQGIQVAEWLCRMMYTDASNLSKANEAVTTALHTAIEVGNADILPIFVPTLAAMDTPELDGIMRLGVESGHFLVVRFLVYTKAGMCRSNRAIGHALENAIKHGYADILGAFFSTIRDMNARERDDIMRLAMKHGHQPVVMYLLRVHANHYHTRQQKTDALYTAIQVGNADILPVFLPTILDMNARETSDVMHTAIVRGQRRLVAFLLKHCPHVCTQKRYPNCNSLVRSSIESGVVTIYKDVVQHECQGGACVETHASEGFDVQFQVAQWLSTQITRSDIDTDHPDQPQYAKMLWELLLQHRVTFPGLAVTVRIHTQHMTIHVIAGELLQYMQYTTPRSVLLDGDSHVRAGKYRQIIIADTQSLFQACSQRLPNMASVCRQLIAQYATADIVDVICASVHARGLLPPGI
jgi:hypothetical protein